MSPADPSSLRRGNIHYFPVVPGRVEFALAVRQRILEERPGIVAVELPWMLEKEYLAVIRRLPEMSVIVYPDAADEERAVYVVIEPADPFVEAVRTALEIEAELYFLEPDVAEKPHIADNYPDSYAVRRIGAEAYVEAYRVHPQERDESTQAHAAGMAWRLQGTDPLASRLVVVSLNQLDPLLDAMEIPQDPPADRSKFFDIQLVNPHPDCLAEITVEMPFLQDRYEFHRLSENADDRLIDKPRVQIDLLREAGATYHTSTGETLAHWQRRSIARYSRNLAATGGDLIASLFDLTIAARSIVDDNYGWEVWQMANRYPSQQQECELETVNLSGDEVWLHTKKLRIRRRLPRPKQQMKAFGLKRRKKEKFAGEWAEQTDGSAICSYPPEDLVIETYGRFLKTNAKRILSEERMRVEPFTTSILDGIDIRETIRNWYERKIYVRHFDKISGEVGAVCIIFDEDKDDRYQYLTTWLGEHQNESDMAFYSTFPFDNIVGPGIGRAEYGGLLMTLPPRRMQDVWSDTDYDFAENKPERLLLAALDYSFERNVVYVAAKPPRPIFRSIAGRMNRKILYIPIGQLSPTKLKRIRVVHVLDDYGRRETAKDYIW